MRQLLTALMSFAVVSAVPAGAAEPMQRIEDFARGLESIEGGFRQQVYDAGGELSEDSRGSVALARPNLFRWEYVEPFPQLIVADGERVWIHDPDLEQVTVRLQDDAQQQSPLSVLIDPAALARRFAAEDLGEADGLDWVGLVPRGEDAGFERARLGFDGDRLARMELDDALGQRTVMSFSDWRRNPVLPAGHFRFVPPPEADLVGDVPEGALVFPVE